jgi:hypothetical protein
LACKRQVGRRIQPLKGNFFRLLCLHGEACPTNGKRQTKLKEAKLTFKIILTTANNNKGVNYIEKNEKGKKTTKRKEKGKKVNKDGRMAAHY